MLLEEGMRPPQEAMVGSPYAGGGGGVGRAASWVLVWLWHRFHVACLGREAGAGASSVMVELGAEGA